MSENHALSYWEDFAVGNVEEFGDMLVTEADIVRFATEFDPQPFHIDAEAAKKVCSRVCAPAVGTRARWRCGSCVITTCSNRTVSDH